MTARMRGGVTTGRIMLGAGALAALHRAFFVGATRDDVVFSVPALDGAFYHYWARSLAEGGGDFQGPYFLGPLYPQALALLYRAFGPDPWHARLVQTLLGVACVVAITGLGCRLFGRVAGACAGVLLALFGPLAFYEGILVLDVLLAALVCALLVVVATAGERASLWRALVAGILIGVATLARPTALFFMPVVLWSLGALRRRELALACMAATALVVTPVVVRNVRQGGGVAITTNGGVNFWAGNNAEANGRYHAPPGIDFFTSPIFAAAGEGVTLPPALAARALSVRAIAGTDEAADSGRWTRDALGWMAGHPIDAVWLGLRKVWLVLQAREIAQIESFDFHARRLQLRRMFPVDFGWLWPLAAVGFFVRRTRAARLSGAFAAAALLPCLVFFVSARYRLPAVAPLALIAGAGAAALVEWVRRRDRRALIAACTSLVLLAVVTRAGGRPPRGAAGWEHAQMAERLYAVGDRPGAIREQERAVRELPDHPAVHINLALYWQERGDPGDLERAVATLRAVCDRWPRHVAARYNLGVLLLDVGDRAGAEEAWRATLGIAPGFQPAQARLEEIGVRVP